jgi:hypothetical protein
MARKQKAVKLNAIEGGDTLIGTAAADQFVLREGQGDIVVEGFEAGKDKILFDFNSYSDVLGPLGFLSDGQEFTDFTGGTHFTVSAVDANGDGLTDTRIDANSDSIIILGVAPDSLSSGSLMGG